MIHMSRRLTLVLAALALIGSADASFAKHKRMVHGGGGSWTGTWSGAWGGRDATAITVAGNRVVSYQYGGQTTPVHSSRVTASRISYSDNGNSVVMTRTGANTAHAKLHSSQGDGEADLTRQ